MPLLLTGFLLPQGKSKENEKIKSIALRFFLYSKAMHLYHPRV
jgi:hypothetical protein